MAVQQAMQCASRRSSVILPHRQLRPLQLQRRTKPMARATSRAGPTGSRLLRRGSSASQRSPAHEACSGMHLRAPRPVTRGERRVDFVDLREDAEGLRPGLFVATPTVRGRHGLKHAARNAEQRGAGWRENTLDARAEELAREHLARAAACAGGGQQADGHVDRDPRRRRFRSAITAAKSGTGGQRISRVAQDDYPSRLASVDASDPCCHHSGRGQIAPRRRGRSPRNVSASPVHCSRAAIHRSSEVAVAEGVLSRVVRELTVG